MGGQEERERESESESESKRERVREHERASEREGRQLLLCAFVYMCKMRVHAHVRPPVLPGDALDHSLWSSSYTLSLPPPPVRGGV
jgi:hypothetical protein